MVELVFELALDPGQDRRIRKHGVQFSVGLSHFTCQWMSKSFVHIAPIGRNSSIDLLLGAGCVYLASFAYETAW